MNEYQITYKVDSRSFHVGSQAAYHADPCYLVYESTINRETPYGHLQELVNIHFINTPIYTFIIPGSFNYKTRTLVIKESDLYAILRELW